MLCAARPEVTPPCLPLLLPAGPLPREWGRLGRLLQLELGGNALTGSLPAEWGALRQAASVDLAGNALAGPLPPAWGGMAGLQMLSLMGNQLSGVSAGGQVGTDVAGWKWRDGSGGSGGRSCREQQRRLRITVCASASILLPGVQAPHAHGLPS